ncbi:MAG: TOMM precursor leader peptide-binding protein [Nocardioides sp.]
MRIEDWLPARPRLRPGLRAVRRDGRHLQVGLDPDDRLVLPDTESTRRLLADLEAARRPALEESAVRGWCRELMERGLVVDADAVDRALRGSVPRSSALSAFATAGPSASTRLAARSAARAAVGAAEPWRTATVRAMSAAGLAVAGPGDRAVVHLVVNPDEGLLDELMRTSEPHLVVSAVAGRITLGPFVSPGRTACSRCVTAHRCDRDPGHATVREQHTVAPDDLVPADPLLVQLATAWAVRDLVSYVEGDRPATWSSTIAVDQGLALDRQRWLRHPGCGCSWGDELAAG